MSHKQAKKSRRCSNAAGRPRIVDVETVGAAVKDQAFTDLYLGNINVSRILEAAAAGRIRRMALTGDPFSTRAMLKGRDIDEGRVEELRAQIEPFEPYVVVRLNNGHWKMLDGHHRLRVQCERGNYELDCWVIESEAELENYRISVKFYLSDGSIYHPSTAELLARMDGIYTAPGRLRPA